MAGGTYRFLLRMPEQLRARLADAAARAGRSLNAELVHRLEQSLEEDAGPRPAVEARRTGARTSREGVRGMPRRLSRAPACPRWRHHRRGRTRGARRGGGLAHNAGPSCRRRRRAADWPRGPSRTAQAIDSRQPGDG
ncbi:MAG: Arc family DNA-binding protein [Gaiellaceae bacterium]